MTRPKASDPAATVAAGSTASSSQEVAPMAFPPHGAQLDGAGTVHGGSLDALAARLARALMRTASEAI